MVYSSSIYSSSTSIPTAYPTNNRWRLEHTTDFGRSRPSSLSGGGGGGSRTSLVSRSANSTTTDQQRRNHQQPRDYSISRATTDYSSPRYAIPTRKDSREDKMQHIGSGMGAIMRTCNSYQRLKSIQPESSQYPQRVVGTTCWDGYQRKKDLDSEFQPRIDQPKISNNLEEDHTKILRHRPELPPRADRPKTPNHLEECKSKPRESQQHPRIERTKIPNNVEEDYARKPKPEDQCMRIDRSAKLSNDWEGCQIVLDKHCGIGLYNPMNNCFLNSVLQAVLHLPQLARAILESKNGRMCVGNMDECFHCELQKHLCRAIRSPFPLNPDWIQPYLRKIFPQHRNGAQEDAHEMLILLLSALEPQQSKQTPYGLKNHQQTSQSTLIEQIFGGSLRNKVVCNNCNFTHTNYEHIRELNLGLTRTDYPQLSQLIDDFFKEEQLQNFHCSMCQKMQTATRHTSLLSAPSVLIIQLKRFNTYGGKNCTPVHANPQLDLTNYSENKENINYHLYGVIEHIGSGLSSGHYVCAMHGFDNQFYLFNDSDVKPVNYNYVAEKLQPYILFYTPTKEYAAVNKQEQERPELAPTIPRHQSMYKDENRASILPRSDSRQKLQMNNDTTTTFVKYQPEEQQPRRALLDDYQTKTLPRPPSRQQNLVDNEDIIAASQQPSRRYRDAFQTAPAIPRHQNMINNDQQREQLQDTYKATTPRPISRQPQQNKNDEAESTAANQAQQLRRYLDTNSSYQTVTLPRRMYYSQYDEQPQTTIPRRIGAYSGSSGISSPFVGHRERLNSTSSNPSWYRTIRTPSSTRI